jgi:cytosine/adenosine deaminase-related metal-dependent hydrolase
MLYTIMWIHPEIIITMAGEPLSDHAILIEGERIADIVPSFRIPTDADVKRYPGGIAFPAFVNMHTHLYWSAHRGLGDDLPLPEWIYERVVPTIMKASDDEKTRAIELGIERSFDAGITTVLDTHIEQNVFEIAKRKGMRGVFFLEGFGIYSISQGNEIKRVKRAIEAMLSEADGNTHVGFSPHAPYTVTPSVLKKMIPWARENGLPIMTHLAEVMDERLYFEGKENSFVKKLRLMPGKPDLKCKSPVDYFAKYDVFGPDVFLIHCVDLNSEEISMLADTGCKVVTCPTSNAKLGAGIAPVTEMHDAGLEIFLGTDSEASCDEFDMFEEMRRLILFQRGRMQGISDIDARKALSMCTSEAAKAAGFDDIGTIEKGKTADIVIVSPDSQGVSEHRDPYGRLVWGGHKSDIKLVTTRGRIVREKDVPDA